MHRCRHHDCGKTRLAFTPGLYFIPAILKDPERRRKYRHCVNWQRVDTYVGVGGVRMEDTVLVTDDGPVVLTAADPTRRVARERRHIGDIRNAAFTPKSP